ncbi:TPA: hypothetical protein ACPZPQ_003550 [Yersinia enterocolitica]
MDDKSIEMLLSEKKFISKRDVEFIRKQAIGNNISFKISIAQLKRISLGTIFLHFLLIGIGINIFITSDFSDFESYVIAAIIGVVIMNFVAPVILGAKLLFVSLKE